MAHPPTTEAPPARGGTRSVPGVIARLLKCIAAGAAVVALAGCGVRLAYSHLDRLIPWYLSDYVTLEDEQRAHLDQALATHLAWHCSTQIPLYLDWLQRAQQLTASPGADAGALQALADEAELHLRTLATTLAPDLAQLLSSLDEDQVGTLLDAFADKIEEDRETYLDPAPEQRARERIARMEKRLVKWLGPLEASQQAALARWSDALRPSTEAWLAQREVWRQRLGAALRERTSGARFAQNVAQLFTEPDRHWPAMHRENVEFNRTRTFEMLAEVHAQATARQLAHLGEEIASLSGQFSTLACTPPAASIAALQ